MHPRRTKIVATIGPSSASPEAIAALIDAGMDGARLNLSHGTQEDHARTAGLVRKAEEDAGRSIALIADLQGPKLRVGDLDGDVELATGESVVIAGEDVAHGDDVPVAPAVLGSVLRPGNDVLIDDGLVRLRVESVEGGRARCSVVTGGTVRAHKGVDYAASTGTPIRTAWRTSCRCRAAGWRGCTMSGVASGRSITARSTPAPPSNSSARCRASGPALRRE